MTKVDVHELASYCGEFGAEYYLYCKSYGFNGLVFEIETETKDEEGNDVTILVYATENIFEAVKKWNEYVNERV